MIIALAIQTTPLRGIPAQDSKSASDLQGSCIVHLLVTHSNKINAQLILYTYRQTCVCIHVHVRVHSFLHVNSALNILR